MRWIAASPCRSLVNAIIVSERTPQPRGSLSYAHMACPGGTVLLGGHDTLQGRISPGSGRRSKRTVRSSLPIRLLSTGPDDRCQGFGGLAVASGHGMRVHVQRRGGAGMAESLGDRGDRNAGRKHLRGHEVAKVVEAKVRKAGNPACGDEVLGHPVGLPRRRPVGAQAEHEGVVGKLDSRRPRGSRFA
jgi:hypothetical protein